MMKKISIFSIWLAILMVLFVSVLAHHHHPKEVCFIEMTCALDGNVNDSHTGHSTSGQSSTPDSCSVEQIKHIVKNEKCVQQITQTIEKQSHLLYVFSPYKILSTLDASKFNETSQEPSFHLLEVNIVSSGLRAPPLS